MKNIFEVTNMPITESFKFFSDLFLELNDFQMKIAKQVLLFYSVYTCK